MRTYEDITPKGIGPRIFADGRVYRVTVLAHGVWRWVRGKNGKHKHWRTRENAQKYIDQMFNGRIT